MKKAIIILIVLALPLLAQAKDKYYSPSLTGNFILYMLDPDSTAGWAGPLKGHETAYIPEKYQKLPVFGGFMMPMDRELLLEHNVKHVFVLEEGGVLDERVEELRKLGMTVTVLSVNTIDDYPDMLRELGKILGVSERAEELANYGEKALAQTRAMVADLKAEDRKRVYVAHGPDGLTAMCNADALDIGGGINVVSCPADESKSSSGFTVRQVNIEQIMSYNPDVIIASNPVSGEKIKPDARWQRLRAYKEGHLYVVPYGPFGWMHMPPVTRFMGSQWIACTLYPDKCSIDLLKETQTFTNLFMHVNLTEQEAVEILYRDNPK